MLKKLRTLFAALLLVPALFSNASAFTSGDDAVNPARPPSATCTFYWYGIWITYEC